MPNGLLLDYAMEFADLKSYNGVLTDSNKVNARLFKDIYTTVLMSGIHTNAGTFYHPDYFDSLWQVQRQPGIITLSGLYYNYARLRDDAVTANLITVTNDQFIDKYVNSVWQNPYQTQTVFAMSPPLHAYSGKSFNVVLPSNLWLTNNTTAVSSIAADFNDGTGYRTLTMGQQLTISYADTGTKAWTFKLILTNNSVLYSQTEMKIQSEPNAYSSGGCSGCRFPRPGGPVFLTADQTYFNQAGQGWITVDYANADLKLHRPLIVVEGFDPGHLLQPELQFGYSNFRSFIDAVAGSNSLTNLLQSSNQQYDIIYVDWAKGTDFLQRNALLLERVIRWVNEQKAIDGSIEPNVVLGQSMGGVISRWALRDMENKNLNHQARLFISYDGPQLGANIPTSFQHLARHGNSIYITSNGPAIVFGYNNIIRPFVNAGIFVTNGIRGLFNGTPWNEIGSLPSNSQILAGLNLMDVPAARQMLMNRINLNGVINNNLHNDWQTELRNLGFPQQSRNIAVSNGSECGVSQGFQPYATLMSYNGKANTRVLTDFLGQVGIPFAGIVLFKPQFLLGILPGRNEFFFDFYAKAQPNGGTSQIYKGKIDYRKKVLYLVNVNTTITNRDRYADPSVLAIDGSPGGMYDTELNLQSSVFQNWAIKYNIIANSMPQFNFVPTPSALDIGGGNTALTLTDYNASYVGANPPPAPLNTSFANFTTAFNQVFISNGSINNNENHIQIATRNGNFVAEELNGNAGVRTNCSTFCTNGAIIGNTIICTSQTLTAPFGIGATYNWTVSNTSIVTLTPNGNSVLVTRNSNANGQAILTVNISGACGNTTLTIPIIVGKGANSIVFNNCTINCNPNGPYLYTNIAPVPGATNCNWYYKDMSNANNPFVFMEDAPFGTDWPLRRGNRNYTIRAEVINPCGTLIGDRVVFAPPCTGGGLRVIASPNPTTGNINLAFSEQSDVSSISKTAGQDLLPIRSFKSTGKTIVSLFELNNNLLVRQWTQNEITSKILNYNIAGLRKGLYVLQVDRDNKTATTKIIVE